MRPRSHVALLASIRYAWAAPNTLLGCAFAILALASGGRVGILDGVIEVYGGWLRPLLRSAVPLRGGARAMALGHVVLARTRGDLEDTREHERVHVRQCERWGPLFIPAYLGSSAWEAIRGRDAYRGNTFEREAFERAPR